MNSMLRCTVQSRHGHRCRLPAGGHRLHRAFGHTWNGHPKVQQAKPRDTTPGWSRRGTSETHEAATRRQGASRVVGAPWEAFMARWFERKAAALAARKAAAG